MLYTFVVRAEPLVRTVTAFFKFGVKEDKLYIVAVHAGEVPDD